MLIGVHVRTHLQSNQVIATTDDARRVLARVVLQLGRPYGLIAFAAPDTHLHLEVLCSEREASELCRRVAISLTKRLRPDCGFSMYPHIPIRTQSHLVNAFEYVLSQDAHHGVSMDPFRVATNLPDLLGLRLVGAHTADLARRHVGRVKRSTLLSCLGVEALAPLPASGTVSAEQLLRATLRAAALPHLGGRRAEAVAARRALLEVAAPHLPTNDIATLLGLTRRAVRGQRLRPVDADLVRAIRLQLDLASRKPSFTAAFVA